MFTAEFRRHCSLLGRKKVHHAMQIIKSPLRWVSAETTVFQKHHNSCLQNPNQTGELEGGKHLNWYLSCCTAVLGWLMRICCHSDTIQTLNIAAPFPFFWHDSRRHVCRGCTGHLMLVKRELRSRLPKDTEQTKHPNKTKGATRQ